jgi:hypothetical protein
LTVDNTPANWRELEAARRPWLEPLYDWWAAAWLKVSEWRQGNSPWRLYVFGLGMAVVAFMGWRELRGGRWRRARRESRIGAGPVSWPGVDSEFYAVLKRLEELRAVRPPAMPLRTWMSGFASNSEQAQQAAAGLDRMLELHYRLRFDPAGLKPEERSDLRSSVARWLEQVRT